jgi:hypothetical protein
LAFGTRCSFKKKNGNPCQTKFGVKAFMLDDASSPAPMWTMLDLYAGTAGHDGEYEHRFVVWCGQRLPM